MSTATLQRRHALGLPAGSVRAIHVLLIVGMTAALIVNPTNLAVPIPPYLVYLLFLMIGHYFAAHGVTIASGNIDHPKPLWLPGGTMRLLIILALAGAIGWKYSQSPENLLAQFERTVDAIRQQPFTPLLILGGFFVGVLMRAIVGRTNPPRFIQDFEAWVTLLAGVGLAVAAIIHLIIDPSLEVPGVSWPMWEGILGALVAFYFGARS
jgi:hypothetical protein